MRKYTAALLASLSLAFAPAPLPKPDPNKAELKKLQGEWLQVSVTTGGRMTPAGGTAGPTTIVITGYQLQYRVGGKATEWALLIDVKKNPKVFDINGVGEGVKKYAYRGVYRVDGDTLTVCSHSGNAESVRPPNFDGSKPGVYLEVFKRVKR